MTSFLSVPNWSELQHYKDRTPPWIKLHNELLESYEFECLPDASKAHLLCIWLLASRTDNKINPDPRWIGRKIGANSKVDIDSLVDSGFLQLNQPLQTSERDASNVLHTSEQSACTEREGEERESRVEESKDMSAKADGDQVIDSGDHSDQVAPTSKSNNDHIDIFNYWISAMGKNPSKTKPTPKRIKLIKDRLKNYSPGEIKLAIDGCKSSPHHMGQNDAGTVYDDLTLICRSDDKLEGFRDRAVNKPVEQRNVNSIGTDFSPPEGWN